MTELLWIPALIVTFAVGLVALRWGRRAPEAITIHGRGDARQRGEAAASQTAAAKTAPVPPAKHPDPVGSAAREELNARLNVRPDDIVALQELAALLESASDWNGLLTVYNNIIFHTKDPAEVAEAYLKKAKVLAHRLNLRDKGIAHLEKCLAFQPDHAGAREELERLRPR